MDVSWGVGLSGYLDPLNTGTEVLDSYPTNSAPNEGCTLPSACNYDPDATEDDGSCLIDDACGVCGGDGTSCTGCTDASACNYDVTATIDDGECIYPPAGEPCDCDAEGALSASLDANGASAFYTLDATGSPETLSISLDWTNTGGGGNWAADVAVAITSPDGNCIAVGGYNSSPAGCSSIGDYTEWPSGWQSSTSGTYTADVDLNDSELSGSGTWSIYLFNGYSGSSGAQFDATWSISGLCNGDNGGGDPVNDCPPTWTTMASSRSRTPCCCWVTSDASRTAWRTSTGMVKSPPRTCSSSSPPSAPNANDGGSLIESAQQKAPALRSGLFSYPGRDLNPHGPFGPTEFKSVVSTNSTIRAWCEGLKPTE